MQKKLLLALLVLSLAACGSSSSSSSDDAVDTSIATTVPGDVVLSSPTATTATNTSIAVKSVVTKALGDPEGEDYLSKKEALQNLIAASGDCSFTLTLPTVDSPECYGPVININNHPDADGDPDVDDTNDGIGNDDTQLPPSDTGLWSASEGDEACAAAKMNELVAKVAARVDNAMSIFAVMACAGEKASLALPTVGGDPVDYATALADNAVVTGLTVNTATMERLADDGDGNAVYQSTLNVTMGIGEKTETGTLILKHIPTADDNSTYKGKLSMTLAEAETDLGNCRTDGENIIEGSTFASTILYSKTSASSVVYEMNYGEFCGPDASPLDDNNNIDPADKFDPEDNLAGWGNNWNYGLFSLNPTDGNGSVAYAWQAGAADGRTRVLNVTTEAQEDGSTLGTAYYGYGPDVSDEGLGSIDGFVCNWAGPNGAVSNGVGIEAKSQASLLESGRAVNKAQKQLMSKAAGDGTVFASTEVNITYAPTNSCNAEVGDFFLYEAVENGTAYGPGVEYHVNGVNDEELAQDNNRGENDAEEVANDLIDLSAIDFAMPTAPSDV